MAGRCDGEGGGAVDAGVMVVMGECRWCVRYECDGCLEGFQYDTSEWYVKSHVYV